MSTRVVVGLSLCGALALATSCYEGRDDVEREEMGIEERMEELGETRGTLGEEIEEELDPRQELYPLEERGDNALEAELEEPEAMLAPPGILPLQHVGAPEGPGRTQPPPPPASPPPARPGPEEVRIEPVEEPPEPSPVSPPLEAPIPDRREMFRYGVPDAGPDEE